MDEKVVIISETPLDPRVGEILGKLIAEAKLNNCYITSVLKESVPKGYRVTDADLKRCAPFLEKELDFMYGPRLYITLGKNASKCFVDVDRYLAEQKKKWGDMVNGVHMVKFQNQVTGTEVNHLHLPTEAISGNKNNQDKIKKALAFATMFNDNYEVMTNGWKGTATETPDIH